MALKLSLHMIQIVCEVYLVAIIFNTPLNTQNNLGIPFLKIKYILSFFKTLYGPGAFTLLSQSTRLLHQSSI